MLPTAELKKRYEKMLKDIETQPFYCSTGTIDVYCCQGCGKKVYTVYGDKGVTPFIIGCHCGQYMTHSETIDAKDLPEGEKVQRWIRPTYRQLLRMNPIYKEHILHGGLVFEEDVKRNNPS